MNIADQAERAALAVLELLALTDDPDQAHRAIVNRLHGELAAAKREGRREGMKRSRGADVSGSQYSEHTTENDDEGPVRFGERV
jgi:hypothetical protein